MVAQVTPSGLVRSSTSSSSSSAGSRSGEPDPVARPLEFSFGELAAEFGEAGVAVVLADRNNPIRSHTKSPGLNSHNHDRLYEHGTELATGAPVSPIESHRCRW